MSRRGAGGTGRLTRSVATIAGVAGACVAYGVLVERRWYRLRRLQLTGVLRAGGPLRILHVSDVHLVPGQQHRIDFLASLAEENHDLAVATGDLLGWTGAEQLTADALAPLTSRGRPGLVVLGSNDLYGPVPKTPLSYFSSRHRDVHGARLDTDQLVTSLADHDWTTLRNETMTVDTAAGPVAVGGIDDPHLGEDKVPPVAAVTPAPSDPPPVLRLGLVHAPYRIALDTLVEAGHDLLLSGHTHGGQVRFPPIGALVANCDLPLGQVRGASRYRGRWLHVSPGLGHSRYAPFRFACRPEATVLELTA